MYHSVLGTGTPVGDPIEANALGRFFLAASGGTKYIGSVKTNIGHLEAAAGTAGLIKVLLMMKHGLVVPSLMYTENNCNPKVDFKQYGLSVPIEVAPWRRPVGSARKACVNSFGFGGTNAHAIVTQFDRESPGEEHNNSDDVLTIVALSALDNGALQDNVQSFVDTLEKGDVDLRTLGYTSTCRREHRFSRVAFVAKTQQELETKCANFLKLEPQGEKVGRHKRKVFVFCGVGTAWNGMCKELMNHEIFKRQISLIDDILETYTGWRIGSKFESDEDVSVEPLTTHIAIFACQVGLAALWKHYGIVPDVVTGQSVGEVAAAYVSGSLGLQDAVKVIYYRSYFLSKITGGTMMVIKGYPTDMVQQLCDALNGSATVAVFSSPEACTISGTKDALEALKTKIKAENKRKACTFIDLNVRCAYHSKFVESVKDPLANKLKDLNFARATVPVVSTVSGAEIDMGFASSDYWGRNVREAVQLEKAVMKVASGYDATAFIEIGPSPVLRSHMKCLFGNSKETIAVASMKRGHELDMMYEAVATLFTEGEDFTWSNIVPLSRHLTSIPRYKFQNTTRMLKSKALEMKSQGLSENEMGHLYVVRLPDKNDKFNFQAQINPEATPFMYEHIIRGHIVVPGAYYADIGLKIVKCTVKFVKNTSFFVSLHFKKPVRLDMEEAVDLNVTASMTETDTKDQHVSFTVKHLNEVVCKGSARRCPTNETKRINIPALKVNLTTRLNSEDMYSNLAKLGFRYGPSFRIMQSCVKDDYRCLVELCVPESVERTLDQTFIHPCVLDSMLQSCVNVMHEDTLNIAQDLMIFPLGIEKVNLFKKPLVNMLLYMKRTHLTVSESMVKIHFNAALLEYDGEVILEMTNYVVYGRRLPIFTPDELKYQLQWLPVSKPVKRETQKTFKYVVCGLCENLQNLFDANKHTIVSFTGTDANKIDELLINAVQKKWDTFNFVTAVVYVTQAEYGDITPDIAVDLDTFAQRNCFCLRSLIMFFINEGLKIPLYVVTENTQRASGMQYSVDVNLKGSELWGFVRSIQYEFVHSGGRLTLVDMSPSLKACLGTFQRMMKTDILSGSSRITERLIVDNRVMGAQFLKSPLHELLPGLQTSYITSVNSSQLSLQSSYADEVKGIFLLADQGNAPPIVSESSDKTVMLSLSKVCLHPTFLLPVTQTEAEGLIDIWSDNEENGHQVIGIEYTGLEISTDKCKPHVQFGIGSKRPKATKSSKEPKEAVIALHPSKIMSEVCVPRTCTVKAREIKDYVPGLLTTIVMLKALVDKISDAKTVVIVTENVTSLHARLCALMVQSRKKCTLVSMNNSHKTADAAIVLDAVREEKDVPLPKVKRIICIKSTLSTYLQNSLFFVGAGTIVEVDSKTVFTKDNIAKALPEVVAWYNKQSKSLIAGEYSSLAHSAMRSHALVSMPLARKSLDILSLPFQELRIDKQVNVKEVVTDGFGRHAAYVVVGGLTGLGWETVQILAQGGARLIAIMSRRGTSDSRNAEIAAIEQQRRCRIICCQCDITDYAQVESTFSHIRSESSKADCIIEGIFQGAGVLEGSLIQTLTEGKLSKPMRPKILGTLNLHLASKQCNLKYFVMQSSITSVLGNLGQCAYAAGNAFMDTFAFWRRRKNLSAISINWGALEVGMATRDDFTELFIKRGYLQLTKEEIKECLHYALVQDQTGSTYTNINWEAVSKDYSKPNMERLRLKLSVMLEDTKSAVSSENEIDAERYRINWEMFESSDMKAKDSMLTWLVQAIANYVIPAAAGKYTTRTSFAEIGMDSMTAVTFTDVVNDKTRVRIPLSYMLELDRCLKDVVGYLMKALTGETCIIEDGDEEPGNENLDEKQSEEKKAGEYKELMGYIADETIPDIIEQQAYKTLDGPVSDYNSALRMGNSQHVDEGNDSVKEDKIGTPVIETERNETTETFSRNRESIKSTENQTIDNEIPEPKIDNAQSMVDSNNEDNAGMKRGKETYTDVKAPATDDEKMVYLHDVKKDRNKFDNLADMEKTTTQNVGSEDIKGTCQNKSKERWGEWIRRKTKAESENNMNGLKGISYIQGGKKGVLKTFATGTASTSQAKPIEKWDEWIHRKESTSKPERQKVNAELTRIQKHLKDYRNSDEVKRHRIGFTRNEIDKGPFSVAVKERLPHMEKDKTLEGAADNREKLRFRSGIANHNEAFATGTGQTVHQNLSETEKHKKNVTKLQITEYKV